jgi:CDP-diacylglycerol--glycerol-3-phosphate 3-phosphatidyltransferase
VGVVVGLGAAAVIATGHFLAGGVIVLVAGLFDMLDGALARSKGEVTRRGAFVDSVADRVSEAALLFALLLVYTGRGSVQETVLAAIVLTGSLLTSYTRARAEGLGLSCKVGLLTRPERVLVLGIGLLANQLLVALWVLAVFSWVTVLQRVIHVWRQEE